MVGRQHSFVKQGVDLLVWSTDSSYELSIHLNHRWVLSIVTCSERHFNNFLIMFMNWLKVRKGLIVERFLLHLIVIILI